MRIDVARPRFRFAWIMAGAWLVLLAIGVGGSSLASSSHGSRPSAVQAGLALAVWSTPFTYLFSVLVVRYLRAKNNALTGRVARQQPGTRYAGYARIRDTDHALSRTNRLLVISTSGIYSADSRGLATDAASIIDWSRIESVSLVPAFELRGSLEVRLHDASRITWTVRDDCQNLADALAEVAGPPNFTAPRTT